jgi:hypothetical protein
MVKKGKYYPYVAARHGIKAYVSYDKSLYMEHAYYPQKFKLDENRL